MILTLFLYAKPQGAAWPLAASILDPVRLCLVVAGPARIVETARWFTNQKPVFNLAYLPIHEIIVSKIYREKEGGGGGLGRV
jgi:hypothetical protein